MPHRPGRVALAVALVACSAALLDATEKPKQRLTLEMLDRSLELGRRYLLSSQRDAGHFVYEYDFIAGSARPTDSPVRQAGALWGLVLVHLANPSPRTQAAATRGLAFFREYSRKGSDGRGWPAYPERTKGKTNTVALLVLALVDFLRDETLDDEVRRRCERQLNRYMNFLMSLRRHDGLFAGSYDAKTGEAIGTPSPYADGEALLAMARVARYTERRRLRTPLLESARRMHGRYVKAALQRDPDSDMTKGFYQWASLAFFEINDAGWDTGDRLAKHTVEMAHWMIDTHRTLKRTRNTGYAYEGLTVACELARRLGDEEARAKFERVIHQGLYKLISWQVGGPHPTAFLQAHPTGDPKAIGGVMNGAADPILRIDVTQHQMHAVILARWFLFGVERPQERGKPPAEPDR